jgi:hypothetical protein
LLSGWKFSIYLTIKMQRIHGFEMLIQNEYAIQII